MPQLDKITFLTQIAWLLPILLIIYWFLLKWILPTISTTLKLRNRLIKDLSLSTSSINNEAFFINNQKQKYGHNVAKIALSNVNVIKNGINFENQINAINMIEGIEFKQINTIFINNFISIYLTLVLTKINKNV